MPQENSLHGQDTNHREVVKELLSHDLEYKAVILRIPESEQLEVDIYRWKEEKNDKNISEDPLWERIAGPFVIDDQKQAEEVALENLHLLSGEITDTSIDKKMRLWLREYSGDYAAEFLQSSSFTARTVSPETEDGVQYKNLDLRKVAVVHDLYIVQVKDKSWMNGILEEDNILTCWGSFDSLESALDEIKQSFLEEENIE